VTAAVVIELVTLLLDGDPAAEGVEMLVAEIGIEGLTSSIRAASAIAS